MPSVGNVQLVEGEGGRNSYFSYAVNQREPLSPEKYEQIEHVFQAERTLLQGGKWINLEGVRRWIVSLEHGSGRDMDAEEVESDPRFREIVRLNQTGSTIAFERESDADAWFGEAKQVFSNPEFFDQVKFFNWIVGNEDQYGFRNMVVVEREWNVEERMREKGRLFLIDFAACFRFLHNDNLNWRQLLQRFYSNLHFVSEKAPSIFVENIKPIIINFLALSPKTIMSILNELRFGELTAEEKSAIYLLLLAEKEVIEKDLVKRLGI
jgi:hypothetical protein